MVSMAENQRPFSILIAEDDEDDYLLTVEALKGAGVQNQVHWVKDGEELMDFLRSESPDKNGTPPRNDPARSQHAQERRSGGFGRNKKRSQPEKNPGDHYDYFKS